MKPETIYRKISVKDELPKDKVIAFDGEGNTGGLARLEFEKSHNAVTAKDNGAYYFATHWLKEETVFVFTEDELVNLLLATPLESDIDEFINDYKK